MQDCTAWRLRVISGQLACSSERSADDVLGQPCRAERPVQDVSRFCCCEDALDCIEDGHSVAVSKCLAAVCKPRLESSCRVDTAFWCQVAGFVGCGSPEYLLRGLRAKYDATSRPSNLEIYVGAPGGKGRGIELLAAEGLLRSLTYGWLGQSPKLLELVMTGKAEAWNFPLGISKSFLAPETLDFTMAKSASSVHCEAACFLAYCHLSKT